MLPITWGNRTFKNWCLLILTGLSISFSPCVIAQGFELKADASYSSNGLRGAILFPLLQHASISNDNKDQINGQLMGTNRFGSFLDLQFKYELDSGFGFKLGSKSNFVGQLPKEVVQLLLYGNARFAGEKLNIGPLNINVFNYYTLGVFKRLNDFKIGFQLLLGNNIKQLQIKSGSLFTAEDGSYIDLDIDYEQARSNPDKNSYSAINGLGFGLDFSYETDQFKIGVEDLGLIFWNSSSVYAKVKGNYRYNGFSIDDISDLNEGTITGTADSTISEFTNFQNRGFNNLVIGRLFAEWESYNFKINLNYFINGNHIPELGCYYKIIKSKQSQLSPSIFLGGYGLYGLGLLWEQELGTDLVFGLETKHIYGVVVPQATNGVSLLLKLSKEL